MDDAEFPEKRPQQLPTESTPHRRSAVARLSEAEAAVIPWLEGLSDNGRWGIATTAFAGGTALMLAQSPIVAAVGGLLILASVLLAVVNIRMTRVGYSLPESLVPMIDRREDSPGAWQVDLMVENLGRSDDFKIKVGWVSGFVTAIPATGTSLNWKGHADGDWKRVDQYTSETAYFIREWRPQYDRQASTYTPHLSTIQSSTGPAALTVSYDMPSATILLLLTSRRTGKQALYNVVLSLVDVYESKPCVNVQRVTIG